METKNFEQFLNEDYHKMLSEDEEQAVTPEIAPSEEAPVTDAPAEEMPSEEQPSSDVTATEQPIAMLPQTTPSGSKALFLYGAVDALGQESALFQAMNQIGSTLDCCEAEYIKLYQLNIQPVSDASAPEPADGMSFIYDKMGDAAVVVVISPVMDGDVSSLTQTVMKRISSHYKNMELKNKVFASLLVGDQNSQQLVKADLANQANNLGFIVGAGTTIFDVSQIQALVQSVKEIKAATDSIRTAAPVSTAVGGVLNFDQFSAGATNAATDLAQGAVAPETDGSYDTVADTTDEAPVEDETTDEAPAEGEEAPLEDEATDEAPAEGEEGGADEVSDETAEEEELSKRQHKLPGHLLKAILKSKHLTPEEEGLTDEDLDEDEEIEEVSSSEIPTNESTNMKKIHHISRFSEMKTTKAKNPFEADIDAKKMSSTSVKTGNVKTEVAPNQKVGKNNSQVSKEIKPDVDNSKMPAGTVAPTKGAKVLGKGENGEVAEVKNIVKKKGIENFSDFTKVTK